MNCSRCGATRTARPHPIKPGEWTIYPRCECELAEYNRHEADRNAKEEQEKLDKFFGIYQMPARFKNRRIENFEPDAGSIEAFEAVKRFLEGIEDCVGDGAGLWIEGQNGNGKTHLAASLFHVAKEKKITSVFVVVPEMLKRIRKAYDKDSEFSDWQLIDPLASARLLILDDIGQEKPSDWQRDILYTVINQRYERKLSTIITTNKTADVLAERIGMATVDRLLGMCRVVENKGESRRLDEAPTW